MDENIIRYTALGDSLTVGVGSIFAPGFVSRYTESIETAANRKVERHVFAKNGATTAQVLEFLTNENVKQAIAEADVITITAGGNDLRKAAKKYFFMNDTTIFKTAINESMKNLSMMLHETRKIKEKRKEPYIIRMVGLYNPFPYLSFSELWIKTFNKQLEKFECKNLKVARIYEPFKANGGNALSIDGVHPNGYGYKLIADQLKALGYDPLFHRNKKTFLFPIFD
ncbi:GDSL-type esterase/lipase family protein [Bacillus sp. Marseille-Q3570]|uniref:GDSL-type esterase/lipase family protein n=1 Tax=Bacillus sp. Marseille-Q3570 TaxID=2963522 RepID=UPI0021B70E3B|nr:GDSL-type esterase/lipase family protein [Bacillus sp. Marseille-Q3570]